MTLKKILFGVFVCSQLTLMGQIGFGNAQKINDDWKFILQDSQNSQTLSYDDSNWEIIDIPHDWSIKGQLTPDLASCTGYLPGGIAWYRKTLEIPSNKIGQKVYLYFEGVYNRSEVFINGKSLGKRPNGYISFAYDATPYVNYGQENTIAVRVDHSKSADSRWYTGSGMYRNVWLIFANPIHMAQWGVYAYPEIQDDLGTLNIEVDVVNESEKSANLTVINELIDDQGKSIETTSKSIQLSANASNKISEELKIDNPKLWSLEHPNLYQLKTTILKDAEIVDENITQTGFRKFTFHPNKGFALNDEWMKVKGVCLHHDAGVLGAAVPKEVWKSRLQTLKELGVNAIRTSHNPQAPDFYDLCDELGLLVLNEAYDEWEFPKRKWLEGWNVGTPGFEGSHDIFAEWAEKDLEDFVRRDRNHLSVFAWSIGNEVDYPNDPYSHPVLDGGGDTGFTQAFYGGYREDAPNAMRLGDIAKRLVAAVKKFDTSRPTTAGLAGVAMSNETEYPGALDIVGHNYTESKYQSDHEKYPNRVIYGSENRHDLEAWKAVTENEHIFGQFLWTGIDYLGESGRWPSRGFESGLLDISGNIKPRGYFRQSLWSDNPMIYIGTYPINNRNRRRLSIDAWPVWSYENHQTIRVVCYTNAPNARLELNGKMVGEEKKYDKESGVVFWDIPFQTGKLEAVGLSENGEELSRYTIETPKAPYAIKAKIENDKKVIGKNKETILVRIELVDEHGVLANLSENDITCNIEGPARLLGLEAGNNQDMSDYTDNTQAAFRGKILAYIQATGDSGKVKVAFSSPSLKPVEINFEIE